MANDEVALKLLQILPLHCRGAQGAKTRIYPINNATFFNAAIQNKSVCCDGFSIGLRKLQLRMAQGDTLPLAKCPFGG
jgi:hypothetical protein